MTPAKEVQAPSEMEFNGRTYRRLDDTFCRNGCSKQVALKNARSLRSDGRHVARAVSWGGRWWIYWGLTKRGTTRRRRRY
jgi:hypothetical protein